MADDLTGKALDDEITRLVAEAHALAETAPTSGTSSPSGEVARLIEEGQRSGAIRNVALAETTKHTTAPELRPPGVSHRSGGTTWLEEIRLSAPSAL